jgi:hypothetical protein
VGQGIGPATLVRRRPDALWRDTPSGVLVLGDGDDLICVEGAGRLLWLVLEQPATMAEIQQFFTDPDRPDPELLGGLEGGVLGLVELGLVELS